MAKTGTITKAIRTGYQMKIVWTVGSQSVANNNSSVTVKVQLVSTGASYTINSTASKSGSLTINGTKYTFSFSAALSGNQTKTLYTKTVTVGHNADGSKTCAFASTIGIKVTLGGTYYGDVTASGSGTFDTIPRATTPTLSASSVNMGASITINMPRASGSFDHTLTYTFGKATGTIGTDLGTSKAWTVPLSLASQIPSGTSGTCTITCKTYNGSTLVGTKSVSFTAKVPASVVPTISAVSISETVEGLGAKFGAFVQGKSKVKISITAAGAYGSTIKTYKTTVDGKSYSGATPTTGTLSSGNKTVTITVTDSRGRTAKSTRTFSVVAYTAPTISVLNAVRALEDGTENYDGQHAKIACTFAVAPVGDKNSSAYTLEYKTKSGTTWTKIQAGTGYTLNTTVTTDSLFDVDSAYDIRLSVTDYFTTIRKTVEIPTAFTLLDFNASGRAVAFGKVSELAEGVEFGLPVFFSHGEAPASVTYLTEGQDFDTILDPGFYAVPSTAISGTLLNRPYPGTSTGSLVVLREGNGGQRSQIFHVASKPSGAIYERCYYTGTWGDWKTVYNGGGKILWEGALYMTGGHKITLAEAISKQPSGIVLVFSRYDNGAAEHNYNSFFVHRAFVALKPGVGSSFRMNTVNFSMVATKYLYINDTTIAGNDGNDDTGTANGVTYNNAAYVLRYVIGV